MTTPPHHQNNSVAMITAAAAAGAITTWLYYNVVRPRLFPATASVEGGGGDHSTPRRRRVVIPSRLSRSPYGRELRLAVTLAQRAGDNMRGYLDARGTEREEPFRHVVDTMETKSCDIDFCTQVDLRNEREITQGIREVFPTHAVIGEESVERGRNDDDGDGIPRLHRHTPTWIVDPVDGTTNFARGLSPLTCVSIGLCVDGRPVMGVVHAPASDEWFYAVHEHGAYRNGVPVVPKADLPSVTESLRHSVVCCEFGYCREPEEIRRMLDVVSRIMAERCTGIRQLGSTCLDMCFVATGQVDVFYVGVVSEGGKPWDFCAATVICQEAGCVVETIPQRDPHQEFNLYGRSVICAVSRQLADETRAVITGDKDNDKDKKAAR